MPTEHRRSNPQERWPAGDPRGLDDLTAPAPDYELLSHESAGYYYYSEVDPGPTKAWMIHHREDLDVEPLYQLAFGARRPAIDSRSCDSPLLLRLSRVYCLCALALDGWFDFGRVRRKAPTRGALRP
eukprot:SAG11_NODE_1087_length_5925_cov_2.708376_7_plen_127_part_00